MMWLDFLNVVQGFFSALKWQVIPRIPLNHWRVTAAFRLYTAGVSKLFLCVFLSSEMKLSSKCVLLFAGLSCLSQNLVWKTLTWFLFTGGPGVHDPCEREPTDVLSDLSAQQADAITDSAQVSSLFPSASSTTLHSFFFCSDERKIFHQSSHDLLKKHIILKQE